MHLFSVPVQVAGRGSCRDRGGWVGEWRCVALDAAAAVPLEIIAVRDLLPLRNVPQRKDAHTQFPQHLAVHWVQSALHRRISALCNFWVLTGLPRFDMPGT